MCPGGWLLHDDVVAAFQVIQHLLGRKPRNQVVALLLADPRLGAKSEGQRMQQAGAVGGPERQIGVGIGTSTPCGP